MDKTSLTALARQQLKLAATSSSGAARRPCTAVTSGICARPSSR